jgi:hypothetical protein
MPRKLKQWHELCSFRRIEMRIPRKGAVSIIFGLVMAASLQAQLLHTPRQTIVLTSHTDFTTAHTNVLAALTNKAIVSGTLVTQSGSNIVISSFGEEMSIPRSLIKSYELTAVPAIEQTAVDSGQVTYPSKQTSQAASNSILAECYKPHSESEMRSLLQTPAAQELLKNVANAYIGAGTDPQILAAKDSYFKTMQEFASGSIGISEIQSNARGVLGELDTYAPEMNADPQAARWNESKEKLKWFVGQAAPSPNPSLQY